jgi:hypothetical protein
VIELLIFKQADDGASVGKVRPMLSVVPDPAAGDDRPGSSGSVSLIDELVRQGAQRMLAEAVQAEVDAYLTRFAEGSATSTVTGWWCATATTSRGR